MRWVVAAAVLVVILASCEDNVTNVTVARDSVPAVCRDTVVVVKRVPCVWRDRVGWICLDAPLPDEPDDDHRGDVT